MTNNDSQIRKRLIAFFSGSLFFAILLLFILNHYGSIQYEFWAEPRKHVIKFTTFFDNYFYGHDLFLISEKYDGVLLMRYSDKLPFYIQAIFVDFIPLCLITFTTFFAILMIKKFTK
jgi:hypothetical protein